MTAGVAALVREHPWLPAALGVWIGKHARNDCPNLSDDDRAANDWAIRDGDRVMTSWRTLLDDEPVIWIWTEADRSSTCAMLPSEY
jgi:hypothetical protein